MTTNTKNGLNQKEIRNFSELLIKSNKIQITVMLEEIQKEIMRRTQKEVTQ